MKTQETTATGASLALLANTSMRADSDEAEPLPALLYRTKQPRHLVVTAMVAANQGIVLLREGQR